MYLLGIINIVKFKYRNFKTERVREGPLTIVFLTHLSHFRLAMERLRKKLSETLQLID